MLDQVCAEKNISREVLVETVEQAVATAAKKVFEDREIEASFDPETGNVNLFQVLYVVEEVQSKNREISLDQAQRAGLEAEIGDELLFQIFYLDADRKRAEQQAKDYSEIDALQFARQGFGRAHHRVVHFVNRMPGLTVAELLDVLKITKQSLARVLKQLIETGHVVQEQGPKDRRQREIYPTAKGRALALALARPQSRRISKALEEAGPDNRAAVEEFLRAMVEKELRPQYDRLPKAR